MSSIHRAEQEKLEKDVQAFLDSGKKIEVAPITKRAMNRAHSNSIWKLNRITKDGK